MKKRTLFILLCCLLVIFGTTGCGANNANKIKKLNVNLEKYDLPCVSGDVCDEVKGKIVQIDNYESEVNGVMYTKIILTDDGNIYLYSTLSDKMVKVNGNIKLTHVDGVEFPGSYFDNALIYQDEKYYSIGDDGTIKEFNFGFDTEIITYYNPDVSTGVDKNGTLNMYASCDYNKRQLGSDKCPTDDTWVIVSPADNALFKDLKIKEVACSAFVTENGKVYSLEMLSGIWDYKKLTYGNYDDPSELENYLLMENPKNMWCWTDDGETYNQDILVQGSDNKLYYSEGGLSVTGFDTTIEFNENVEKVFFAGGDFLMIGESNVYLSSSTYSNNNNLIKLDDLKEYKNDIRGLYMMSRKTYVLLSDGNLYKVYE